MSNSRKRTKYVYIHRLYRYILYAFDYLTLRLKGSYQQLLTAPSGPEENEDEEILLSETTVFYTGLGPRVA